MPDDHAIKAEVGSDRLEPFAAGDFFLGATLLNDPDDDHAGDGRIFQFDKDFNQKAVLHTPDTTHLVKGCMLGPDGVLWAFDTSEHMIIQVGPDGKRRPNPEFPKRPWSSGFFDRAGNLYLYEHITGTMADVPEKYQKMQRTLPGESDKIGDGNVYKFAPDGTLLDTYETETSTSFAGYLGVTSCTLHPSEQYITYTTETSKRIMRYDIVNHRQMEDLVQLPQDQPEYVFCLNYCADGMLLVTRGPKIEVIDEDGKVARTYPLEGRGWATIKESADQKHILVSSFFNGVLLKMEKDSGDVVGQMEVHVERALAGVAEYPG
jgi:sugar lactone lactonase YvrE